MPGDVGQKDNIENARNEVAAYKNDLKDVERFGGTPEEIANIRSNIEAYEKVK